jgi:hypothetical protein
MIAKAICWWRGHRRGVTKYLGDKTWSVRCRRCGFKLDYQSPHARLVGTEMREGFTQDYD